MTIITRDVSDVKFARFQAGFWLLDFLFGFRLPDYSIFYIVQYLS